MVDQIEDRFPRLDGSESGFSMIEMLIAMVVIMVGLVSVVGISAYVSRTNSVSSAKNVLGAAAQDQVDRLRTARWTRTYTDPSLAVDPATGVGGFIPSYYYYPATASTYAKPNTYTLDSNNPYHAVVSNTPAGDLNINWQVRQGSVPELRYVTIKVVQINAPPNMRDGFTVTTIISRN